MIHRRLASTLPLLLAVGLLAACSSSDGVASTVAPSSATAASPTSTTIPLDERYQGPDAADYALTNEDLPAGFTAYPQDRPVRRADEPPQEVDRGSGLCGVRNPADTSDPLDRIQVGYSQRTGGPFVYETVAVYDSALEASDVFESATGVFGACVADGDRQTPRISGASLDLGDLGAPALGWSVRVVDPVVEPGQDTGMGMGTGGAGSMAATSGRFYVECSFSHRAIADPIVFPATDAGTPITVPSDVGHEHSGAMGPGMVEGVLGHQHEFFGAATTSASSTADSLLAGQTTCAEDADHSAYWVPTLFDHGKTVTAERLRAWYSVTPGVDPAEVQPLPNGLQMIAGNIAAKELQSTDVVGWSCGTDPGGRSNVPPEDCTEDAPLSLQLVFPSCWNGEDLSSPDHRSHLAYPGDEGCPADHPVAIPRLTEIYEYGLTGGGHELEMAMGGLLGVHGDVLVAWNGERQETIIDRCIRTGTDCGGGIGPQGYPAFADAVAIHRGPLFVLLAVASFDPIDPDFTRDMAARVVARLGDS
ncbi:MAG: DUF1996 domain-containing protein [Acidimicrobiales bacterium]|nr:DUF1996 domain-containing protein [Acidimicrobiales bacterium]